MRIVILTITLLIILAMPVLSQPGGVQVGNFDLIGLPWGNHAISFEIINNSNLVKYLTVETEVSFEGTYLNPKRSNRSHHIVDMESTDEISTRVIIPPNYGRATVYVRVFDVVDTLDDIGEYMKVFEQPFHLKYNIPDEIQPYFQERIDLPPRVENTELFDSEFPRVMLLLIDEGRTLGEIARMAMIDSALVVQIARPIAGRQYLASSPKTGYRLNMPFIELAEAERTRELVDDISGKLADMVQSNLTVFHSLFDSLIAAGIMPADSNEFLHGGDVLYREYPLVAGLLLWHDLGRRFITRSAPMYLYNGTNVCDASIHQYMYAVEGGEVFNGTQFFHLEPSSQTYRIYFGDALPDIECVYDKVHRKRKPRWNHSADYRPEGFIVDTGLIRPVLGILGAGGDKLIAEAYSRLKEIALDMGHAKVSFGHRYWFWNFTATRTVVELTRRGVITRRGNGQFRFDGQKK